MSNIKARLEKLDERKVLVHLGASDEKCDSELKECVQAMSKKLESIACPKIVYKVFDISDVGVITSFVQSNDVMSLLKGALKFVVFGATLGAEVDGYLRRLQISDMANALVFDAAASVGIENVCNSFCEDIQSLYGYITPRFSPGYGDLPLEAQNDFDNILELQKNIGVTLTQSNILVPQKSVTALFGVSDKQVYAFSGKCKECQNFYNCSLRKGNTTCGK